MDIQEKAILCTLHSINGLGGRSLWRILESFASFRNCFEADARLLNASFLAPEIVTAIVELRRATDPLAYWERLQSQGVKTLIWNEPDYPDLLKNTGNPPYILYYRGSVNPLQSPCIALVGSRQATAYGRTTARRLAMELAGSGITVVSGMARGIDSEAHRGALEKGRTVAVLGSGLNVVYPRENERLYQQITESGAVLSEFPLNTRPEPGNFPMRNRIISGISRGVAVIEAKMKSGALITADFALEQGRDVFAVPGPINSKYSEGANNLIKQGAKLISGFQDIVEEYFDLHPSGERGEIEQEVLPLLDGDENRLLECMGAEPVHFEELLHRLNISIGELSTRLLQLELQGIIGALPGNYYIRHQ